MRPPHAAAGPASPSSNAPAATAATTIRRISHLPLDGCSPVGRRRGPIRFPYHPAMRIEGAAALVTGGASGLGGATVRRLAAAGAAVTIVDRDGARGKALADELGGATRFAEADVADPEQVQAAVDAAGEA